MVRISSSSQCPTVAESEFQVDYRDPDIYEVALVQYNMKALERTKVHLVAKCYVRHSDLFDSLLQLGGRMRHANCAHGILVDPNDIK